MVWGWSKITDGKCLASFLTHGKYPTYSNLVFLSTRHSTTRALFSNLVPPFHQPTNIENLRISKMLYLSSHLKNPLKIFWVLWSETGNIYKKTSSVFPQIKCSGEWIRSIFSMAFWIVPNNLTFSKEDRSKLQDKQKDFLHRKPGECAAAHCLCSAPGGGSLPRTVSPIATGPWDPGIQAPCSHQNQAIKGHPLGSSLKNQGTKHKNQDTRLMKSSLPGDTYILECKREWTWR